MIEEVSTPIDIVMEFVSLQNTRLEAAGRLQISGDVNFNNRLEQAKTGAKKAIQQLMDEVSNFGDAVKPSLNMEKAFYEKWNKIAPDAETLPNEEKQRVFNEMENELRSIYSRVLGEDQKLPASTIEILQSQAIALKHDQ